MGRPREQPGATCGAPVSGDMSDSRYTTWLFLNSADCRSGRGDSWHVTCRPLLPVARGRCGA
jgi:hypothetical protein